MIGGAISAAVSAYIAYKQHQDAKKARQQQKKQEQRSRLAYRVAEAERAGIHPLAALGFSPQNIPPIPLEDYSGLEGVGRGIASMAESWEERKLKKLAVETAEAEKNNMVTDGQLKSEYLKQIQNRPVGWLGKTGDAVVDAMQEMGLSNVGIGTGNPSMPSSGFEIVPKEIKAQSGEGIEAGWEAFEKVKRDWEGYAWVVPADSQDVEENAYIKAIYYGSRGAKWAISAMENKQDEFKRFLGSPGPGRLWVFRRGRGQFQAITKEQHAREITQRARKRQRHQEERREFDRLPH